MDEVGVHGAIGAFLEQPPLVVEAESLEKLVKVLNSTPTPTQPGDQTQNNGP